MFESVFIFLMKCVWGAVYVGFLIGIPVFAAWLVAAAVQHFVHLWHGKDDTYRFPPSR